MADTCITVAPIAEPKTADVYLLPCEIQYTGGAPVNTYFKPRHPNTDGLVEAEFRGRELKGRVVRLSDHQLSGWLLKDTVQGSVADGEQRRWVAAGTFSELTCYKHDDPPFDNDPINKVTQWVDIASVLHAHH